MTKSNASSRAAMLFEVPYKFASRMLGFKSHPMYIWFSLGALVFLSLGLARIACPLATEPVLPFRKGLERFRDDLPSSFALLYLKSSTSFRIIVILPSNSYSHPGSISTSFFPLPSKQVNQPTKMAAHWYQFTARLS